MDKRWFFTLIYKKLIKFLKFVKEGGKNIFSSKLVCCNRQFSKKCIQACSWFLIINIQTYTCKNRKYLCHYYQHRVSSWLSNVVDGGIHLILEWNKVYRKVTKQPVGMWNHAYFQSDMLISTQRMRLITSRDIELLRFECRGA